MGNRGSISPRGAHVSTHGTGQMHAPPPTSACCSLNRKQSAWLSTVLIASGALGFIGTSMGLYSLASLAETGAGIWCGSVFVATGCVAIVAGHYRTIPLMKATVATAVFSIVFAVILLVISNIGLHGESNCWQRCYDSYYSCYCSQLESMGTASNIVLITSGWLTVIFAIWLLIVASISLRSALKFGPPIQMPKKTMTNRIRVAPGVIPSVAPNVIPSPPLQQTLASSPQAQPIFIFSTHTQPTVLYGQQPPQGSTTLPQVQPVVIVGQQTQPIVVPGNQSQPTVVFRQDPQENVAVNIQNQHAVHPAENQPLSPKNLAANSEASHGGL